MIRASGIGILSLLVGSTVAIYTYAFNYRFSPQWFRPYTLGYAGPIPVYQPWAVYRLGWAYWQRDGALPRRLRLAGMLGGMGALLCAVGLAQQQASPQQGQTWAPRRQVRQLGLYGRHGTVLGKAYGRVLRQSQRAHTLVVGPTQAGKSSILLCTLLDEVWGSIVVHDPKDELAKATRAWREQWSRCINLAPCSPTSDGYNVLGSLRYGTVYAFADADQVATILCDTGDPRQVHSDTGQHFQDLTRRVLVGGILAGQEHGSTTLPQVAAFLREELQQQCPRMQAAASAAVRAIGYEVAALSDNPMASLLNTLGRVLAIYDDPLVARTVSRTDFTLADVREGALPMTLYLSIPLGHQERLRAWKRLVLTQVLTWCTRAEGVWTHECLLAVDELPSLGYSERLKNAPNEVAGSGMRLLYITPSLNAITEMYGFYNPIREGCRYTLVYAPYDASVARTFADTAGETVTEKEHISKSWGAGDWVARRTMRKEERRSPLISATDLMDLADNQALLIVGKGRTGGAARIKVRTVWQGERPWKGRARICAKP